jgi:hypothetical protein
MGVFTNWCENKEILSQHLPLLQLHKQVSNIVFLFCCDFIFQFIRCTEKAMEKDILFEKKGTANGVVDVHLDGNGKHLGCGEVQLVS